LFDLDDGSSISENIFDSGKDWYMMFSQMTVSSWNECNNLFVNSSIRIENSIQLTLGNALAGIDHTLQ